MTTLYAMRGIPGSGKSSEAAKIAKKNDAVVVNRDQLRRMLLNSWWTGDKRDEDRVTMAEEVQVTAFLGAGVSTVIDACHLHPPFLRKWARLAARLGVEFQVIDCVADPEDCKRRAYERWRTPGPDFGRYVDPAVIDKQASRWPVEKWPIITAEPFRPEPVEWVPVLAEAVVVDLDNTMAIHNGRGPFEYSRVREDLVNEHLRWLVNELAGDYALKIIVVSGREDSCREDTEKWLVDNRISYDEIHMRKSGDYREDFRIKYEIFDEKIRGRFNVRFCLDDREQVTSMFRSIGLTVLDVAGNEF